MGVAPAGASPDDSDSGSATLAPDTGDLLVFGAGAGAALVGRFLWKPGTQFVPTDGLNREEISLDWDRHSIGEPRSGVLTTSDGLLALSLVTPTILELAGGRSDWNSRRSLWTLQAKSTAVAAGAAYLLKSAFSRPRPYTYLSDNERGTGTEYDVLSGDAFASFPSGHAAVAWASSLSGLSYLILEQPELPGWTHFLGGFLAGGISTSASLLRVEGMQHFPTDVAAGAAIGAGAGVTLALLDRESKGNAAPAWRRGLLGLAVGTAAAFLLTPPTSPWID